MYRFTLNKSIEEGPKPAKNGLGRTYPFPFRSRKSKHLYSVMQKIYESKSESITVLSGHIDVDKNGQNEFIPRLESRFTPSINHLKKPHKDIRLSLF